MLFARFFKDRRASALPIFGLSIVPIVGFIGAAVDYSRANSVKADMQAALDATALMLAKSASGLTADQLQQTATASFLALFNRPEAKNPQVSSTYSVQSGKYTVTVSSTATVNSNFLGLVGNHMDVGATAQVAWGNMRLRVALVLDNTGSMTQGSPSKISMLKSASHQLLQQLQAAAANPGDVQVAIIPFTTDVNVGTSNVNATWVDWTDWDSANQTCTTSHHVTTCTPKAHSNWNGCVYDRTQPNDTLNTTPTSGNIATKFPAHQASPCPVQLMGLSYDWTALNAKIDAMTAGGNTNQTIGLQWGWQALTQGNPLNAPELPPYTQQVVILLTDGLNTQNHWTSNPAQIDARTAAACTNIKAAGIQLYTVLVMSGDSQILQDCASDPSMYFALTQSGQIITTFNKIGTSLAQLRLSK